MHHINIHIYINRHKKTNQYTCIVINIVLLDPAPAARGPWFPSAPPCPWRAGAPLQKHAKTVWATGKEVAKMVDLETFRWI